MPRSHRERRQHWAAIMVDKPELDAKYNAAKDKKRMQELRAHEDAKQAAVLAKIRADKEHSRTVRQMKREERKQREQQQKMERQKKVHQAVMGDKEEDTAAMLLTSSEQEQSEDAGLETIPEEEPLSLLGSLQQAIEYIDEMHNNMDPSLLDDAVRESVENQQMSENVCLHSKADLKKHLLEVLTAALPQSTPGELQQKTGPLLRATSAVNQVLGNITRTVNKRTVATENIMNIINKGGSLPSGKENRINEVESALAELDSLPDGDNDRDTPEDDWQRYGDMDTSSNQTEEMSAMNYQQQQEPVHRHESPLMADSPDPYKSEPMEVPQSNGGGGSPHSGGSPSGSPRSVEGFVTSVELNTAQEQLANSTTAVTDLDAAPLEQQSGPFSVYVSSSPEPASLDPLVDASVQKVASPSPSADYEMQDSAINSESVGQPSPSPVAVETEQQSNVFEQPPSPVVEDTSSVEIVHAQSMVEVVAPPSPTHEPELQFVTSQPLESEPVPSPVYTPAPLNDMMSNDLMSTSMILEQPISDAPEQVEQMMQFVTTNTEVVYNSLEQQQTAEVVHITSESDRLMSPEVESGNLLDAEDSEASYPAFSPAPVALSPVAAEPLAESPVSPQSGGDDSLVEQMNRANINDSYNAPSAQIVSPSEPVELIPSPVQEEPIEADLLTATVEATPEEQTEQQIPEPCEEHHSPVPSPIQADQTPVSDVIPSTPIKEPMIGNRPISPIHTPKADMPVHDSEILSEIAPPSADAGKETAPAKKAPVKPTPRTTTAATTRSRPTASAVASSKTTPATTNVKPGTPRPTARATPAARTTPGGAVRSTATTTTTKTTTRATPTTRTTPAARTTTPSSRSTSATSTTATRTTTTRTPLSRNATPSATRTTPSSSATRPTSSTGTASRPTPTTRTSRPTTTPTSSTLKTTTTRTTPRSASRPTSAATTPTTTRRGLTTSTTTTTTVRRTLASASAAAKDTTDSKTSTTTTRAPYTRKPLYPGPAAKTATAGAKTASTADKDVKNSTNKMLSSRTTTLTRSTAGTTASRAATAAAPTHKPLASRTTTGPAKRVPGTTSTLKSRTTTTTTKTGLKAKSAVITANASDDKKEITSPETNGEVKIAQEETSVEVVTKEQNEEIVEVNGEEAVLTTTTSVTEVLVNGDGDH